MVSSAATTLLLTLLRERGLKVVDGGSVWVVNRQLTYAPHSGFYRLPPSLGGGKGTLHGSPEDIARQIDKLVGK